MRNARAVPLVVLFSLLGPGLSPGEDPKVTPYLGGRFPARAPRESDAWSLVTAFPHLTFKDMTGLVAGPRSTRLYVTSRQGQVWWFENDPEVHERHLFLDVSARCQGWDDSGLLGLAFHPEFGLEGSPNRRYVYAWYCYTSHPIQTPRGRPFAPPVDMTNRLSRFTLKEGKDELDPESELVLIDQHDRHLWHNGGGMFFDEKGLLYISLGDEGADFGNENHVDLSLFSGVIRIDVDQDPTRSHPIRKQPKNGKTAHYLVPNDNPWVGVDGALEEFWAIGLRNPHRMTYDAPTKRIWVGDVGDSTIEEVDVIEKGCNYQWRWKEGTRDHGPRPAVVVGTEHPPIYEYDRSQGYCVIGGYVYRGKALAPELTGKYVFGDLSGAVWALEEPAGSPARAMRLATLPQARNVSYGIGLSSFGVDAAGELYLCQLGDEGHLFKLARTERPPVRPPGLLSQTGAFADLSKLDASRELTPYDVASPLWSDGARKQRWVAAPGPAVFAESDAWRFPQGTVFVKHFERDGRRLETRFLVVGEEVYGLTYRWREDQKDAELLAGNGPEQGPGGWSFPGRDDCLRCHTPQSGWVLGGRTRQLNKGDQLAAWRKAGLVTIPEKAVLESLADPGDATAPLESRVRSYIDANCMHCHVPNGNGRGWFDARATTPLAESGIVEGPVADRLGLEGGRVVRGGEPDLSLLLTRLRRTDERRMPPLAVHRTDEAAARLIEEWIRSLPKTSSPLVGLRADYFAGVDLQRLVHQRVDPAVDFDWSGRAPAPGLGPTDFSVRWRGTVTIPVSGEWTFHISTDDGGRLFVDGKKVIERWVDQGETESTFKVRLEAGRKVPIVFEYYQRGGAAVARLLWSGPGQPRSVIPPRALTPVLPKRWF
jgi:glucose/arabinose dehydrogenase